jgi:hypothetical protein
MTESKAPAKTPEPSAFERMKEFTRRLVAVPKSEIDKKKRPPIKRAPS